MPYSFRQFSKKLHKIGFKIVREGKGFHVIFSKNQITFALPKHGSKDISKGVEKSILKQIGIDNDEFCSL